MELIKIDWNGKMIFEIDFNGKLCNSNWFQIDFNRLKSIPPQPRQVKQKYSKAFALMYSILYSLIHEKPDSIQLTLRKRTAPKRWLESWFLKIHPNYGKAHCYYFGFDYLLKTTLFKFFGQHPFSRMTNLGAFLLDNYCKMNWPIIRATINLHLTDSVQYKCPSCLGDSSTIVCMTVGQSVAAVYLSLLAVKSFLWTKQTQNTFLLQIYFNFSSKELFLFPRKKLANPTITH